MSERISRILLGSLAVLSIVVLLVFYIPNIDFVKEYKIGSIDEWTFQYEDGREEKITLPKKLYIKESPLLELYTILPEEFSSRQVLAFWSYFETVEVSLNNEIIYQSEDEYFGKANVSKWNYVEMPRNSNGKQLTIRMTTPYQEKSRGVDEVVYGTAEQIQSWMHTAFYYERSLNMLFIVLGVFLLGLAVTQKEEHRYRMYHMCAGIIMVFIGTYLSMSVKGVSVYWMNGYTRNLLGCLSFMLLPVVFILYLKYRVARKRMLVYICNLLLCLEMISILIMLFMQGMGIKDVQENIYVVHIWIMISIFYAIVCSIYYYRKGNNHFSKYTAWCLILLFITVIVVLGTVYFPKLYFEKIGVVTRLGILASISLEIATYFTQIRNVTLKQKETEEENRNLQIHILSTKIRPHFILNTLGAIRNMIKVDPDQAYDLLYEFSKYVRNNLEQRDYNKKIPFLKEIEHIETYLKLEKTRMGERLQVEYDLKIKSFMILPLTIQPFVENAVKHGLFSSKTGGILKISTRKIKDKIIIEIKDDGVGFDVKNLEFEMKQGKSLGMKSAIFRLEEQMDGICTVMSNTKSGKSGTTIRIELTEEGDGKSENNHCG